MANTEDAYAPKDAIGEAIFGAGIGGGAGLFSSAILNTLQRQNLGGWGVLTRFGSTAATFAVAGGAYTFTRAAAANLREKDDSWNSTIAGFFAGSAIGLRVRTLPSILGYGATLAVIAGTYDYTGGTLSGYAKDSELDEFERKEKLRRDRRRPIQETIDELGEGRGIYAPGYGERRRETIKDRYGIDVPVGRQDSA